MNTLFTSRLNGVFILNTLLELHTPVTVSELTGITFFIICLCLERSERNDKKHEIR